MRSSSPEQTGAVAEELAARLRPGDVVLVRGEMGTGKTTFVRAACRALGITTPVTSPTFTIGHVYDGPGVRVAHLDLHRLAGLEGEDPALLADYLEPGVIAFVEWPEIAEHELAPTHEVLLRHAGGDEREVEVRAR
jgi:tRNA threonylcarbamoyladenosine biosynthesis protein TsaE